MIACWFLNETKTMRTKSFLIAIAGMLCISSYGQGNFIFGLGFLAVNELTIAPSAEEFSSFGVPNESSPLNYSVLTFNMTFNYTLIELTDNQGISIAADPQFGLPNIYSGGFEPQLSASLTLPFQIKYNVGAGSTYTSYSETGFTLGAGFMYRKLWGLPEYLDVKNVKPCVSMGCRFMIKDQTSELTLLYGFPTEFTQSNRPDLTNRKDSYLTLLYRFFLNY